MKYVHITTAGQTWDRQTDRSDGDLYRTRTKDGVLMRSTNNWRKKIRAICMKLIEERKDIWWAEEYKMRGGGEWVD